MAESRVIRVARTDDGAAPFVLVNVQGRNGGPLLDLRLVGTDGLAPYVGEIRHDRISSLRSKNYAGDTGEWQTILTAAFLQSIDPKSAQVTDGVELVATVSDNINITIRKNIQGITQRLGSVTLREDQTIPVELFEWNAMTAVAAHNLRADCSRLQASLVTQQEIVAALNAQLDELVKAKQEHEADLIQKFAEILNAKKLKIRDQQRLLAAAKVDPQAAKQLQSTRVEAHGRKAGISRSAKRKERDVVMEDRSEADSEAEEFVAGSNEDDVDGKVEIPSHSDNDETETEDSDAEDFAPAPRASQASRGKDENEDQDNVQEHSASEEGHRLARTVFEPPPPKRELPFNKKPEQKPSEPPHNASGEQHLQRHDANDEDETDDDEL